MEALQAKFKIKSEYVFVHIPGQARNLPGRRASEKAACNFLNNSLDYGKDMGVTVSGFRKAFKTWQLNKHPEMEIVGEMALSHIVGNQVRNAYVDGRFATPMDQCRILLERWAKYCSQIDEPLGGRSTRTSPPMRLVEDEEGVFRPESAVQKEERINDVIG
jgi:hypothetical protein